MRALGPQSSYGEAYKVYMDHARQRGIAVVALTTFKNRALASYGEGVELPTNIVPLRPYAVVRALFDEQAAV